MFRKPAFWCAVALLAYLGTSGVAMGYEFPIDDPYASTIIGTPSAYKADLSGKVPIKEHWLLVFPDRKVPDYLWYARKAGYLTAFQSHKAPLIFAIAGTGGSHKTSKLVNLVRTFYKAGFHVITVASPTFPNFVVSASTSSIPGHPVEDAQDLYRVMKMIWEKYREKVEVSEFYLTGYSLGGMNSAFVSKLDEDEKAFNFKKVLMINPPVSLFTSVNLLDGMLEPVLTRPGGFGAFFDTMMERLGKYYKDHDKVTFNEDFLYSVYTERDPPDEDMGILIGVSFRISSVNMVISSDLMTNRGFIIPKNSEVHATDSLTEYSKVAGGTTFTNYFDEYVLPYFKEKRPEVTREDLLYELSLKSIEPYLATSKKISMFTNADDLILGPGDVDFLVKTFGQRALIYPLGGHCGNMDHKDVVAHMVSVFKGQEVEK